MVIVTVQPNEGAAHVTSYTYWDSAVHWRYYIYIWQNCDFEFCCYMCSKYASKWFL